MTAGWAQQNSALTLGREIRRINRRQCALDVDDEAIWDIAAISAFFAMSNRLVNVSAMLTNDEFYLMGRVPRVS